MGKSSLLGTLEDSFSHEDEPTITQAIMSKVFSLIEESKDCQSTVEA